MLLTDMHTYTWNTNQWLWSWIDHCTDYWKGYFLWQYVWKNYDYDRAIFCPEGHGFDSYHRRSSFPFGNPCSLRLLSQRRHNNEIKPDLWGLTSPRRATNFRQRTAEQPSQVTVDCVTCGEYDHRQIRLPMETLPITDWPWKIVAPRGKGS